jgi:hypothetical protein
MWQLNPAAHQPKMFFQINDQTLRFGPTTEDIV